METRRAEKHMNWNGFESFKNGYLPFLPKRLTFLPKEGLTNPNGFLESQSGMMNFLVRDYMYSALFSKRPHLENYYWIHTALNKSNFFLESYVV